MMYAEELITPINKNFIDPISQMANASENDKSVVRIGRW